jgi:hypothetical protein
MEKVFFGTHDDLTKMLMCFFIIVFRLYNKLKVDHPGNLGKANFEGSY